jgi:hypothetical protein
MCALINCLLFCMKKWVPAIKEQWVVITTQVKPHVQSLTAKTVQIYEASKTTVTPHIIRVQEIADPYFQVCVLLYCPLLYIYHIIFHLICLNLITGS